MLIRYLFSIILAVLVVCIAVIFPFLFLSFLVGERFHQWLNPDWNPITYGGCIMAVLMGSAIWLVYLSALPIGK